LKEHETSGRNGKETHNFELFEGSWRNDNDSSIGDRKEPRDSPYGHHARAEKRVENKIARKKKSDIWKLNQKYEKRKTRNISSGGC